MPWLSQRPHWAGPLESQQDPLVDTVKPLAHVAHSPPELHATQLLAACGRQQVPVLSPTGTTSKPGSHTLQLRSPATPHSWQCHAPLGLQQLPPIRTWPELHAVQCPPRLHEEQPSTLASAQQVPSGAFWKPSAQLVHVPESSQALQLVAWCGSQHVPATDTRSPWQATHVPSPPHEAHCAGIPSVEQHVALTSCRPSTHLVQAPSLPRPHSAQPGASASRQQVLVALTSTNP